MLLGTFCLGDKIKISTCVKMVERLLNRKVNKYILTLKIGFEIIINIKYNIL